MENLTPMMKQYYQIKQKYKDVLLFFRVGDFFELFDEDAKIASKELGIALTTRDKKHLMAGVPHHALFTYVKRLIEKGYSVAICDQVEDPSKSKGLVKREIIRIITPGTVIEEELLSKENNYLMTIYKENDKYYMTVVDVSTGEFLVTELKNYEDLVAEILKYSPVEAIVIKDIENIEEIKKLIPIVHPKEKEFFEDGIEYFSKYSKENNIKDLNKILTCGATIKYLKNTLLFSEVKFNIQEYNSYNYLMLDTTTLRNLEIFKNLVDNTTRGTLIEVLNKTKTPMGNRLLKKWIQKPLINLQQIEERLNAVDELYKKTFIRQEIRKILENITDIERITSRIQYNKVLPKELVSLKNSLKNVMRLKNFKFISPKLNNLTKNLDQINEIVEFIEKSILEEPSNNLKDGNIIKEGFCYELDQLRNLKNNLEKHLKEIEEREKKRTGIEKLKIGYNSVIGYYIEVPKSKIKFVPNYYKRKQTLSNYERYTIEDLEKLETKILSSDDRIKDIEYNLFVYIRETLSKKIKFLKEISIKIAELDVLSNFAEVSVQYNYTKPKINNGYDIILKNARHPTVEHYVKFVPNDVYLTEDSYIMIITGPNMAGKSTYLRMVALIIIMAHIGCFVPAEYAIIGTVDKIFTRLGNLDDITRGYSSFMLEMIEVNQIIKNATRKSLVLLDELGKSTSNKDGSSLSWAIIEYLHKKGTKTLFATHFHEVTELEKHLEGVKNYHFKVFEGPKMFDHKIYRGKSLESYGLKIAESILPKEIVERAKEVSEKNDDIDKKVIRELKEIDINNLTPIDALIILNKLVKKCKEK